MFKKIFSFTFALAVSATAAERTFNFGEFKLNQTPSGFVSTVTGTGKPGDWKVIEDEIASALAPLTPQAPKIGKRPVLAQLSQDRADEHFPLLIFKDEIFADFTLTTKFKCVSGETDQMAGIAFRIRDEKNYYVVRASAAGNSFRFYKFVDGQRSAPIGPEVQIPKGVWHEMTINCKGNEIRCTLNGKDSIPTLTDNTFPTGKIGFWTKSDSVTYFADTHIRFTPREPVIQSVVREIMQRYPRLRGLKVFAYNADKELKLVASSDEKEIGQTGGKVEADVIKNEKMYYAKQKDAVAVTLPLRDRNGETVAALQVKLKSFAGQTEQNAAARALPINKEIGIRIQSLSDLAQ